MAHRVRGFEEGTMPIPLMPAMARILLASVSLPIVGLAAHEACAQELRARKEAEIKAQGAVWIDGPREYLVRN